MDADRQETNVIDAMSESGMKKSKDREVRRSRRRVSEREDDVGRTKSSAAVRDDDLVDETLLQAIDTISDSIEPHLERWDRILDDIEASLASAQPQRAMVASHVS